VCVCVFGCGCVKCYVRLCLWYAISREFVNKLLCLMHMALQFILWYYVFYASGYMKKYCKVDDL